MTKRSEDIKDIICPNCGSDYISKSTLRESNGVFGPGSAGWTVDEFYTCKDCGIRFEKIDNGKQKENS